MVIRVIRGLKFCHELRELSRIEVSPILRGLPLVFLVHSLTGWFKRFRKITRGDEHEGQKEISPSIGCYPRTIEHYPVYRTHGFDIGKRILLK